MKSTTHFIKISMFIWGSFTFGLAFSIIIHELGHALAGWLTGVGVAKIVINPLSWSYVEYGTKPVTPYFTTSAGVLLEIIVGVFVLAFVRNKKTPYLTPIVLLGVMLFMHPGGSMLGDYLLLNVGDAYGLVVMGIRRYFIFSVAVILVILGCISFYYAIPRMGIKPEDTVAMRTALLSAGILPFFFISMVRTYFFAPELFLFFLLILVPLEIFLILIAWTSRKFQKQASGSFVVEWKHAMVAFLFGVCAITIPYLL